MQKKMKIFSSLEMYYLSRFGEIARKKNKKKNEKKFGSLKIFLIFAVEIQTKEDNTMTNTQIIKEAQTLEGYAATGYLCDIDYNVLKHIQDMIWRRSVNLLYTTSQYREELMAVIGKTNYCYYMDEIDEYIHTKISEAKTIVCLGTRYCAIN